MYVQSVSEKKMPIVIFSPLNSEITAEEAGFNYMQVLKNNPLKLFAVLSVIA